MSRWRLPTSIFLLLFAAGCSQPAGRSSQHADSLFDLADAVYGREARGAAELPELRRGEKPEPADIVPRGDAGADLTFDLTADIPVDVLPDMHVLDESDEDTSQTSDESGPDASVPPPPLFDHELIRDETTAACSFTNKKTVLKNNVLVDVWNVSYHSWEYTDGQLQPILIKGYAARPVVGSLPLPGIVQAHGLGGFAKEEHATGTASLLGMFVLAYTGPGGGDIEENTSQGLPSSYLDGYRMFDTLDDLRGSWFWGHALAAMRGLTCVENHPDVDPTRLGMTGFSAGGVATCITAGVDNRVKAAVPLSGTLAWGVATQAEQAWQHMLLNLAGLSIASPEWLALLELVDPQGIMGQTQAKVLMVNGSTDEFFPLTAHMGTFEAIPGTDKRTSFAANFDHGCYTVTGGESADDVAERAALRAEGGQRMWFRHWFGTDDNYSYVPAPPAVEVAPIGAATMVTAMVDSGGPNLEVEEVKVWWSNDLAFLFFSHELEAQGGGLYGDLTLFPLEPQSLYFVDVQYKTLDWIMPERFSISSPPAIPAGFVPHVRHMETCL